MVRALRVGITKHNQEVVAGGGSGAAPGRVATVAAVRRALPKLRVACICESAKRVTDLWLIQGLSITISKITSGGGGMGRLVGRLWREEKGQDLTEYGLLLLFIALISIAVIQGLGSAVENIFSNASTSMS